MKMRRRLLVVVGSVLGATLLAASAVAVPPVKTEGQLTQTSTLTGVCSFAIQVESRTTYRQMDYFDKSNVRTQTLVHIDEQDVFTANGKTLIGLPFTFERHFTYDHGTVTRSFSTGVLERVPLPDGTPFESSGRLDLSSHPGGAFVITPDHGNPGNVAGFCAALAGGGGGGLAHLVLTPSNRNFGNVRQGNASGAFTFTASNDGTATSGALTVAVGGPDAADFAAGSDTCTGRRWPSAAAARSPSRSRPRGSRSRAPVSR